MFRLFSELLIAIFLCYSIIILPSSDADIKGDKEYHPPGTLQFPPGDEELNTDILKTGINEIGNRQNQKSLAGSCSVSPYNIPKDTHIACGGEGPTIPPEILYSSDAGPTPTVQCKKCDLTLTPDGTAVIVRCFDCYDTPPAGSEKLQRHVHVMATTCHQSSREQLETVLTFLKDHQWIYNYPNTHILVNKVLGRFHSDWIPHLKCLSNDELNDLPFGAVNKKWPDALQELIGTIHNLNYETDTFRLSCEVTDLPANVSVSVKKRHEIISLAAVIHDVCKRQSISFIIDVGAGLGYLSQLLYDRYNCKVLAIEGDARNFQLALKNQENYPHSKSSVKYLHHFITESSVENMRAFLQENFNDWNEHEDKVLLTGLHACADLSVTVLEIFSKLDFINSLVIMPCCYHRMELENVAPDRERFKYFPASQCLNAVYDDVQGETFLRRPFLRLACQQTSGSWKNMSRDEHERHSRSCIFRAIVQEVADEDNLDLKRLKRKTGKLKLGADCSIENYVNNLKHTHKLVPKDGVRKIDDRLIDSTEFKSKVLEKWAEHKENCYLVEILTAFQTAIQSMCENLVLLDKVEFLREKGLQCNVYRVTDDRISPRCHALVATKL